jgi:hypothetical protein
MAVASLVLRWYLGYLNNKKKSQPVDAERRAKSVDELGDKHPGEYQSAWSWSSTANGHFRLLLHDVSK